MSMEVITTKTDTGDDLIRVKVDETKNLIDIQINCNFFFTTLKHRKEILASLQKTLDGEVENYIAYQAAGEDEVMSPPKEGE